ncbi:hypothetical protein [Paraburkholderia tropica]|uniref:hypothetical protein n=1 Tax=Paraburkholderia tropica TaxID=92647 RepID=UPI002AB14B6C|nr:hypothetical protein [Paraburkholderia tropica]
MNDENRMKPGVIAGELAQQLIELGLSWNDAIGVFGLAAKAIAQAAAAADDGEPEKFVVKGRRHLLDAFDREVRVVITPLDPAGNDEVRSNSLLATARRRAQTKLH